MLVIRGYVCFQDGSLTFAEISDGLRRKNTTFKQEDTKLTT
jgi:hypothetical protein